MVVLASVLLAAPADASSEVTVTRDAAVCHGETLVVGPHRSSCVHAAVDIGAPPYRQTPVTAPLVCFGDGTSGPRVQVLYAYVAGRPNRAAEVRRRLSRDWGPRMQAMITAASKGKDLAIRFAFNPGCNGLSMPVVRVASAKGEPEEQFARLIAALQDLGHTRTDRKYQVILDSWTTNGVCGLGELAPTMDQPHPANVHDGAPTAAGHTDAMSSAGAPEVVPIPRYSVVFRSTFGPRGPDCWEAGQSRAEVQLHELFHTLGAVQLSAPHSDDGGHCTDTPSVMCPVRRRPTVPACAKQRVEVLDCGFDDYWDPDPPSGSYLATADNIATSVYFGPQPQDRLALLPF